MKNFAEIDKNFKVETAIKRDDLIFTNVLETPFLFNSNCCSKLPSPFLSLPLIAAIIGSHSRIATALSVFKQLI